MYIRQIKTIVRYVTLVVVLLMFFCFPVASAEKEYPDRHVEIICPFSPGGSNDLVMRALVSVATQYLGQPLIPITRSGGGGAVGAAFVARSKPDGYTILIGSSGPMLIKPLVEKLPYKGDDFVSIGRITALPEIICVLSTSPWKTLKEFLEDAKKNPGKFRFSSGGAYNIEHILFTSLNQIAGIDLIHIPTTGGGPALTMLLGGHVETSCFFAPVVGPHIAAGKVRPIAVNSPERLESLKEVPTLKELGLATQNYYWIGVFAPKGTPQQVVKKLRIMLKQSCEDKSFVDLMQKMDMEIKYVSGEDFDNLLKEQQINVSNLLKFMK